MASSRGGRPGAGGEAGVLLTEPLEFMRLLWSLDHALQRTSKRMDRTLGVTGPQRLAIRVLGGKPGISAGHVAQALQIHPSTLTGILRRLEQRRLVKRTPDAADARRALLRLTPLGERIDAARAGTVEHAVRRALERLPVSEVAASARVIGKLISELESGLPSAAREQRRPAAAAARAESPALRAGRKRQG